ncbi:hypothetical protein [Stenotrophomonas geniculata]|uniref:hypothetical protein n=1 Tax=Stenotrophomonas geniculata TaxID=86188 RepID=UPI00070AD02D|nr:hypothetical protein [Stenotrophomonas geniculata]KRG42565.1 hypothetical protein ARC63_11020 [Stenotrophomonas geniculata ATCC 19374 = JCM 13324]
MPISFDTGDVIAAAALALSAFATWMTFLFNRRQKKLNETQEQLNRLLLAKESGEATSAKKADLGASFNKLGSNKYRLRVFNKGKAAARNVRLEPLEGTDCLIQSDIDSKFPLEHMEPHQSVDLLAAVHLGTQGKQPVRLIWSDEHSEHNEKVVYPTI